MEWCTGNISWNGDHLLLRHTKLFLTFAHQCVTSYCKRCLKGVLVIFGFNLDCLKQFSVLPESVVITGINIVCINSHEVDISLHIGEAFFASFIRVYDKIFYNTFI